MSRSRPDYEALNLQALIKAYLRLKKTSIRSSIRIGELYEEQMNIRSEIENLKIDQLILEAKLHSRKEVKSLAELSKAIGNLQEKNKLYQKINHDLEEIQQRKNEKITALEEKEEGLLKYAKEDLEKMAQTEVLELIYKADALNKKKRLKFKGLIMNVIKWKMN